jgi:hypothetical protein
MTAYPNVSPNGLAYTGVKAPTPGNVQVFLRAPISSDFQGFSLGDIWIYKNGSASEIYQLGDVVANSATWILVGASTGGEIETINSNAGVAGNYDLVGTADQITITETAGTSTFTIPAVFIAPGSIEATTSITGASLDIDNINIDGNTISSTDTDGDINLTPDGTGAVVAANLTLTSQLTVPNGGTGLQTITDHGVMVGSGVGAVTPLAVGTDGQVLVGSTGADPVFATITSTNSSVATTLGAGTLNLEIDESYLQTATVTIATGDVLTLATTPVELVAAPGVGQYIEFLSAQFILDYNSIGYTEAGDNLGIKYTDAAGVQVSSTVECTGFIDQTADTITNAIPAADAIVAASAADNAALVLDNLGSNFGAGNSPLIVKVSYRVITSGL